MTLEELGLLLAERRVGSSVGDGVAGSISISGVWLSLTSDSVHELRQDGRFLYGSFSEQGNNGKYELEWQEDGTYKGVARTTLRSVHADRNGRTKISCEFEEDMQFKVINYSRISGWINWTPRPTSEQALNRFLRTCGESERANRTRKEFVWVRSK